MIYCVAREKKIMRVSFFGSTFFAAVILSLFITSFSNIAAFANRLEIIHSRYALTCLACHMTQL